MYYSYRNGNYDVFINNVNGTKFRVNNEDHLTPEFAESIDLTITTMCDNGCPYCYLGCSSNGKHANLKKYERFVDSIHPYTEVAINGNDLTHPELEWFLQKLKKKHVFTNITVNQSHFIRNIEKLSMLQHKKLIHGIGVSFTHPDKELETCLDKVNNAVIHTINGVTSNEDWKYLSNLKNVSVLVLGYKDIGRGTDYRSSHNNLVDKNQDNLKRNVSNLMQTFDTIAFDNLAIEQLGLKNIVNKTTWTTNYMGDEGKYTFYVDLVNNKYARHSFCNFKKEIDKQDINYLFANL